MEPAGGCACAAAAGCLRADNSMTIRSELQRGEGEQTDNAFMPAEPAHMGPRADSDLIRRMFEQAATRAAPPFATGAAQLLGMRAERILPHHQRAGAVVGEELEQHRVRHLAVEDHHALDALLRARRCRSRPWGSCRPRWCRRRSAGARRRPSSSLIRLFDLVEHARHVGEQQEPLGLERAGDRAGDGDAAVKAANQRSARTSTSPAGASGPIGLPERTPSR